MGEGYRITNMANYFNILNHGATKFGVVCEYGLSYRVMDQYLVLIVLVMSGNFPKFS